MESRYLVGWGEALPLSRDPGVGPLLRCGVSLRDLGGDAGVIGSLVDGMRGGVTV